MVALPEGPFTSTVREVRSRSADGALLVEVTRTAMGKTSTATQVFRRK